MNNSKSIYEHAKKIMGAIDCLVERGFIEAALIIIYASIDQMSWLSVATPESDGKDFKAWVEKYLSPSDKLGCSADDMWAARNGLIHTAAAESRDFLKTNAKRIYYVSGNIACDEYSSQDTVIINSTKLIIILFQGISNFVSDLESDAQKLQTAVSKANKILAFRAAS